MSNGVIALIAVGVSLAYLLFAGMTYAAVDMDGYDEHEKRVACGIFWPIVLPAFAGALLARWLRDRPKRSTLPVAKVVSK